MMKKLSKIALLAAASAFMLAVFPACGDDDEDNDPPKATLALVGDPVVLKAGTPTAVEAMVTVENDTFSTEAKEAILPGGEIPKGNFELKATDAKVTVSAATLKEWTSDAVAKISFTVTAAEGAEAGTISAEIKAGTLTSNVSLTAEGSIDYTVKSADKVEGTGGDEGATEPSVKIAGEATVKMGATLVLKASASNFPEGVSYEWASSATDKATVAADSDDPSKATVTPVAEGTAKITVKATSGETVKSAELEVSVTAGDQTKGVNAVWDFNTDSLKAVDLTTTAKKNPKTDDITPKSGSGATLKFTSSNLGKSVKIQKEETGGLNIGSGSNESDILLITVDEACTLSFTGKGSSGSDWTSAKVNSFSVKETSVYVRQSADEASYQTWTYKCAAAGDYKIKASGMIFTELKCE